jgi:hypothetical protein
MYDVTEATAAEPVQIQPVEVVQVDNYNYIELLTGPLSALGLALIMIYTIGRWLSKIVPRVIDKYMEATDKTIEQLEELNTCMRDNSNRCNEQTEAILERVRSTSAGIHNRLNTIEPIIIEIKANQRHAQTKPTINK